MKIKHFTCNNSIETLWIPLIEEGRNEHVFVQALQLRQACMPVINETSKLSSEYNQDFTDRIVGYGNENLHCLKHGHLPAQPLMTTKAFQGQHRFANFILTTGHNGSQIDCYSQRIFIQQYTDSTDDIQAIVHSICHDISRIFFHSRNRKKRWSYGIKC